MIAYKQGQVVLIPFPFTDLTVIKQRPGLVISSNKFNNTSSDVIVAAISSHVTPKLSDFDFILTSSDQKSCGLPKLSIIKLGKIITMDKRLVRKVIGEIPKETLSSIISRFIEIIR